MQRQAYPVDDLLKHEQQWKNKQWCFPSDRKNQKAILQLDHAGQAQLQHEE
jgi:hypothetical protein